MESMFYGCSNLTTLNLDNFDTSKVTDRDLTPYNRRNGMSYMFYGCKNLILLDISSFNTSNIAYMNSMFRDCSSLTSLNVSNFNTSYVLEMSDMFRGCKNIKELDLSSFNTSKISKMTNAANMFIGCDSLKILTTPNTVGTIAIYLNRKMYDKDGNEYTTMSVANTTLYAVNPNWSFNIFYGTEQFKGIAFGSKRLYQDITRLDLPWIKQ